MKSLEDRRIVEWIKITKTHATFRCADGYIGTCPLGELRIKQSDVEVLKKDIVDDDIKKMTDKILGY